MQGSMDPGKENRLDLTQDKTSKGKDQSEDRAQKAKQEFGPGSQKENSKVPFQLKNDKSIEGIDKKEEVTIVEAHDAAKEDDLANNSWSNDLKMDGTHHSAYKNLMRSIGIDAPLNIIIRHNNAVLSAKPEENTISNQNKNVFRNMLDRDVFQTSSETPGDSNINLTAKKVFSFTNNGQAARTASKKMLPCSDKEQPGGQNAEKGLNGCKNLAYSRSAMCIVM